MIDIQSIVRDNILKLTPYSCARDEYQGSEGIFLDANENPYGSLNRYPDPYQRELKAAISDVKKVAVEKIFTGNGSDEIIDLCFRVFCVPGKEKALILPPTYGMYEVSAGINDVEVIKVPLNEDFQPDLEGIKKHIDDRSLKLIFLCSPNNPTGNSLNDDAIRFILDHFKGIVVIDEAYIDFSSKESYNSLIDKYNNLVIMQTFSKAMGLAAARVGMAFTNPEIISYFNKVKPPYNISTINQKAALERIRLELESRKIVSQLIYERKKLADELRKLTLTEHIYPSDANFLLIKVTDADDVYNYLVRKNIIIRNRNSVVRNCIRITVGTKTENNILIRALKEYNQTQ